ncbi:MAG: serine protease SohB [bacterium]|jgi:serine protease SohB
MEYFIEYGLFLAKVISFAVIFLVSIAFLIAIVSKEKSSQGQIEIKKINEKIITLAKQFQIEILSKQELKQLQKKEKQKKKEDQKNKEQDSPQKKLFVINFEGDIQASGVPSLTEEITAILTVASSNDEVVVKLNSSGGYVHSYGLAASQLHRIKRKNIPLTVIIEQVAASGGYLMACVANKIISAPFAIIGSIGVVAQIPNVHRLLKKNDIDVELMTAGKYKRTLTMLGENTEKGRQKFQDDLDTTHLLFKDFVKEQRPVLDIEKIATGETWYGSAAKGLNLIDEIMTYDDYLLEASEKNDIFSVKHTIHQSLTEKISKTISATINTTLSSWWQTAQNSKFLK